MLWFVCGKERNGFMVQQKYERMQVPLLSLADMCRELAVITGGRIITHEEQYITYANSSMFYGKNFILDADEAEMKEIAKEIRGNLANGLPGGISFTEEKLACGIDYAEEVLKENGFVKFISQIGMVFDLAQGFPEPDPVKAADIRLISEDLLPGWCVTNSVSFPKPREDDVYAQLIKSRDLITYGYMDGEDITSTGMLLIDPDLAGIHEISTLPEYRRQGHIRTILCLMLQELQSRGIGSVSLQASPAGKLVYETIGFETVSTIPTWVPADM